MSAPTLPLWASYLSDDDSLKDELQHSEVVPAEVVPAEVVVAAEVVPAPAAAPGARAALPHHRRPFVVPPRTTPSVPYDPLRDPHLFRWLTDQKVREIIQKRELWAKTAYKRVKEEDEDDGHGHRGKGNGREDEEDARVRLSAHFTTASK